MAKVHALPLNAAAVAVMSMCVVVVATTLAVPVRGNGGAAAGVVPLMAVACVPNQLRVEDQELPEMDSETHRRVMLTVQGAPHLGYGALDPNKAACKPVCAAKPGEPYVPEPRPCSKIYRCPP
uniref:Uncharacterized protein n=1 Tax=Arundo donax TaxID=35708 RepID=A0A0A9BUZ8_ARUDO